YYLEAKGTNEFIENLQQHLNITQKQASVYLDELSGFLKEVHSESPPLESKASFQVIPNPNITNYYVFGDSHITINYASNRLLQLIHPYLQHASVAHSLDTQVVFDLFGDGDFLYLFKNQSFIGSYETQHFHFLQGKFAMQLTTSIYNNEESDWMATFHASTICNDKEAIMVIGDSGSGKSTLSALLMAHGYDLLADDFTPMLAKNQHLYRFPAAISIKKGAFEMIERLFGDFKSQASQQSNSKPITVKYLPPAKPFRNSQKHFSCHKLVMVNYSSGIKSKLCACAPEKILQTFIPDSWISPNPEYSKLFLNWLKELTFYELTYSDNDFAITKFNELFEL
ncbi:MAG: hypothetical protein R2783_09665, partial [Gelidibacter sp.]